MSVPEELLMAYADGELTGAAHAAERAQIEAAMKADPQIARIVERHKAMRQRLNATFDHVLDEPVPDRLVSAIRPAANSTPAPRGVATPVTAPSGIPAERVANLNRARAERAAADANRVRAERAAAAAARAPIPRVAQSWLPWFAIAASVVICAVLGYRALYAPVPVAIVQRDGRFIAQAGLAAALTNQLASTQAPVGPVHIGTSFKAKSGEYCRTFELHQRSRSLAGLACRAGDDWALDPLTEVDSGPANEGYRTAGSELPAQIRTAVEQRIVGDPLDSSGEARAQSNGWK